MTNYEKTKPPYGQQQNNDHAQQQTTNMNNGPSIKCPKCGGTNLQAISDTHGKGASFLKLCFCGLLGLCGTGKTKTDHYWVCQSCGNKFKM